MGYSFVHPAFDFALCCLARVYNQAPGFFERKVSEAELRPLASEAKEKGYFVDEDHEFELLEVECDLWAGVEPIFRENVESAAIFLGLNSLERDFLTFALVYKTFPAFSYVIDSLCDELSLSQLVRLFALMFPGASTDRIERVLLNESVLSEAGLLYIENPFMIEFSYTLANNFFRKDFDFEAALRENIRKSPPGRLIPEDFSYLKEYELLKAYLQAAVTERRPGSHLLLYGPPGSGKTELVRLLSREIEVPLYEPDYKDDKYEERDRFSSYRIANYLLRGQKALLLYDDADTFLNEVVDKAWFNRVLESAPVPTVWICNDTEGIDPALIRRFDLIIRMDYLPEEARRRMLNYYLGDLLEEEKSAEKFLEKASRKIIPPSVAAKARKVLEMIQDHYEERPSKAANMLLNHVLELLKLEKI